jgi:hypothetical protein
MTITKDKAERLVEIASEMAELLGEFKHICRNSMESNEYQQFKYRCLGNLEPGLIEESEWVTTYSSIDSLESVANNALDEAESEDDIDEND